MHVLCKARARLKNGKAPGADGISATVLKSLRWESLRVVLATFQKLYTRELTPPDSWKEILATLMLKGKERRFSQTRTLALNSLLNKWYMGCLCYLLGSHLQRIMPMYGCQLFGFQEGRRCHEVTSGIKHMCRHARLWGKRENMFLASLDVESAFDNLTVETAAYSLDRLGVDPHLAFAVIEASVDVTATFRFEQVVSCPIPWCSSIKTGLLEGPELWTAVSLVMMAPTFKCWSDAQVGVQFVSAGGSNYSLTRSLGRQRHPYGTVA